LQTKEVTLIIRIDADGSNRVTLGSGFFETLTALLYSQLMVILVQMLAIELLKEWMPTEQILLHWLQGSVVQIALPFNQTEENFDSHFGSSTIKRMNADGTGLITLGSGFA
jgi:putative effector of murein hydrolase